MLSANSLRWFTARCQSQTLVLLASVSYEQRDGNRRESSPGCMVDDHTVPTKITIVVFRVYAFSFVSHGNTCSSF